MRVNMNIITSLTYWTDCAIGTLDRMADHKSTSTYNLQQLLSVANGMVFDVFQFTCHLNCDKSRTWSPEYRAAYKRYAEVIHIDRIKKIVDSDFRKVLFDLPIPPCKDQHPDVCSDAAHMGKP